MNGSLPQMTDLLDNLERPLARRALIQGPGVLDIDVVPACAFVDDGHVGAGCWRPDAGEPEAIQRTAQQEGIAADPIYSGKEVACVVSAARPGRLDSGKTVVFLKADGSVALHAYRPSLNLPPHAEANPSRGPISTSRR
jgi:hypothetical protein